MSEWTREEIEAVVASLERISESLKVLAEAVDNAVDSNGQLHVKG
jgi:hypothetical protein